VFRNKTYREQRTNEFELDKKKRGGESGKRGLDMTRTAIRDAFMLMLLGACLFASRLVRADCLAYDNDNCFICTGPNCEGRACPSFCVTGCKSGICEIDGGSGLCCGTEYHTDVIYADGERCDGCGEARVHAPWATRTEERHLQEIASLHQPVKPRDAGTSVYYREPRILFVPDRCAHTYGVLIEKDRSPRAGGM